MSGDAFWEFERSGWERAAERYEECWTDTGLFVEPLLDAAGVRTESRLLDMACGALSRRRLLRAVQSPWVSTLRPRWSRVLAGVVPG